MRKCEIRKLRPRPQEGTKLPPEIVRIVKALAIDAARRDHARRMRKASKEND